MEEYMKLVAQYQCSSKVDVSSSESDSDSDITSGVSDNAKPIKATKEAESESGKHKSGTTRLPTRRPDPNVYNRNALLARENRRKKKAHMEAVERELHEIRSTNRTLLKALKKQFKLTQKFEKECEQLKDILGNYKGSNNLVTTALNVNSVLSEDRATSPHGSLISVYSSSSYEQPMETGMLNVDNGSVAAEQFINEPPSSSWNDFIDDLLTDYQPTSAYESDSLNRFLEESSLGLPECPSPLEPLGIIEEHSYSYFNKFTEVGSSPSYEWNASCTPPTQLLQDDNLLDITANECITNLCGGALDSLFPARNQKLRPTYKTRPEI